MTEPLIAVDDVVKTYGARTALDHVRFVAALRPTLVLLAHGLAYLAVGLALFRRRTA